ncbi:MAG: hypothetical protein AAGI11_07470 [Pseudomonadota bacterium]
MSLQAPENRPPARIAILLHENAKPRNLQGYDIGVFAECWREDGHRVDILYGPQAEAKADLCIVHVDLSVVPERYIEFARRHPVVLNAEVRDIRKRHISRNLLREGNDYSGPVILKSDFNCGGWPEQVLTAGRVSRGIKQMTRPLRRLAGLITTQRDYRLYDSYAEVPARYRHDDSLVIEKFLPQVEDGMYCIQSYRFFGSCAESGRNFSPNPVVIGHSSVRQEYAEPHPDVVRYATDMQLHFGKIDYCIHQGELEIIDVNKTPGRRYNQRLNSIERVRARAAGIYDYL